MLWSISTMPPGSVDARWRNWPASPRAIRAPARATPPSARWRSCAAMRGEWRYFGTRQVAQARAWAAGGGIAVHENLFKSRRRRAAHLLARDETTLIAAARSLGCEDWWIQ